MQVPAPVRRLAEAISGAKQIREELRSELREVSDNETFLKESLVELERALFEPGWTRLVALSEREFSPEGMRQMRAVCRLYSIVNPLVKRGLNLRSAYVWGQGVEITARANGRETSEQDVQAVIVDFLTDPGNLRSVTGPEARDQLEHALGTDGEVFVSCFTRPLAGQVQVRVIPADEICDIITDPEDVSTPWYYHRRWVQTVVDPETGAPTATQMERYYPALGYRPQTKIRRIGQWPVAWDSPVRHVAVNRPLGWKRGVPDAYAAVDWAKAYKEFLEDWARLMRSLARFAWKATSPGDKASKLRTALSRHPSRTIAGEPESAGATMVLPPDVALESVSKSGATLDADSGRPLAMMVAAALDVPVTMLLSDPGSTGARATAETLDKPTELMADQRRDVWTAFLTDICSYVITEAVRAPKGSLKGTIRRDPSTGREYLTLAGDTTPTVDITWPKLQDADLDKLSDAILKANQTQTVPPEIILRLILTAFGVRGVDEIIEKMVDEDGKFLWPSGSPPLAGGFAALAKAGADPAQAAGGPMDGSDGTDDGDTGEQPGDSAPADKGS